MSKRTSSDVDVLAIGAHPDDVELGVGGLLHKLVRQGYAVAILDLTQGERASRGTVEERRREALEAARILGVTQRENANLPDGALENTPAHRIKVIPFIRRLRPKMLLAPMPKDRHPDHETAHYLVRDANYYSGLVRIDTAQEPHRAPSIYHYHVYGETHIPDFIVDISDHLEAKLEAVKAYKSQVFNPEYPGPPTFVSSAEFWESIRLKAAYWGSRVGVAAGEALYADAPVRVALPPGLEKEL